MKAKKSESKISLVKLSLLKKSALAAILVIFVLVAFSATASAAIINVPDDCTTIQQAINSVTAANRTIEVNATAYAATETVIVDKSDIIIRSVNGRAVVSADVQNDHVFNITNQENVTLQGFEIRDAKGTVKQYVAGIYMYNASDCNISDNFVTNISATINKRACGIQLELSNNNSFSSNTTVSYINGDWAYGISLKDSNNNNSFSSSTNVSYITAADGYAYGIRLYNSDNNNFSSSTNVSYITATNGDAYGILLKSSSNNNSFSSSTNVSNINATNNAYGILLDYSSNNNSFSSNTTVSNINAATKNAFGIFLKDSNSNSFSSSTNVSNINATNNAYGIRLSSSSDKNSFHTSTVYNISAAADASGIYLRNSDGNTFSSGSISDINAPTWWDFYSNENSHGNSAENITISSYPTTISFTYDYGVGIKSVETPPPDPALKSNIGKYVNATNVTANSWLFLNVSYDPSDVSYVQEDSLKMWKHNGTWHEVAGVNGVNTAEKYVYANITDFSVFAPLGNSTRVTIPTATGTGNVTIETDKGYFCNETDALPTSPPDSPALTFPHGFFNVTICGLNTDTPENVTINFTFPSAIPTNAEFWKYNSSNETWYPYPFDSNDGDNVISITITDNNATGDHNPALGVINDPNGIGWEAAAAAEVPALTPIGIIVLVGLLSVIAAVSISMRRKK